MPRLRQFASFLSRRAFTLLELCIVLAVIGLMAGFAAQMSNVTTANNCYPKTRAQLKDIRAALDTYVRNNSAYPMPSGNGLGVTSPLFGIAVTSAADASIDSTGNKLIGALPFATLGLNSSYAADCWGNKFIYAVSEILTSSTTYMSNSSTGVLTIRKGTIAAPVDITTTAAYVVVSTGANGYGGIPRNATAATYCSATIVQLDQENCDRSNDIFYDATFNNNIKTTTPILLFDDLIIYDGKTGFTGCNAVAASGFTWSSCSNDTSIAAMGNTSTGSTIDSVSGITGSASVVCTNGTVYATSATCSGGAVTWHSYGGGPCYGGEATCASVSAVDGASCAGRSGQWCYLGAYCGAGNQMSCF